MKPKELITPVSILILAVAIVYTKLDFPKKTVDGVQIGKAYGPILVRTYRDAWNEAAKALEDGKSVGDAQEVLRGSWNAARVKAFEEHVGSKFSLILPEGEEPSTPEKRAEVVDLWRDFAKGLK